jgi:hypothetical protein
MVRLSKILEDIYKEADFDFEDDERKTRKRTKFKKTPEVVAMTGAPSMTKNNPAIRDK